MAQKRRGSIASAAEWPADAALTMPCPETDGALNPACRSLLEAMPGADATVAVSAEALALGTGLPLYRVRAVLAEAIAAALVVEQGGFYRRSEAGERALAAV